MLARLRSILNLVLVCIIIERTFTELKKDYRRRNIPH
jgi:hypothetical protein